MRNAAGVLGIIGLFAAIALGMLATFGFFGPKAPLGASVSAGQGATIETKNRRAEQAASVGETVKAGDVS